MRYRITGRAEDRIDAVLLESVRQRGIERATRYHHLLLAAMTALGDDPALPGSRPVPRVAGIRALHLYSARRLVSPPHRVGRPRHLLVYHVAQDGIVEILSVVHDRMQLTRAARRAQREADG